METTTLKFYSLNYNSVKTYLAASLFIVANLILPQLFHAIPNGGITFLPIYFFTLIGAYKYGWKVGLLTAVLSPSISSLLFGMPMPVVLPAILLKSVLLALAAGAAAHYWKRISIPILALVVLVYQIIGTLGEWLILGDFYLAIQDFRMGIPGMLLQVVGGYLAIKYLKRKLSRQINLTLASKDESNKDNSEQMDVSTKIIPINSQNYPPQQSRGMRL